MTSHGIIIALNLEFWVESPGYRSKNLRLFRSMKNDFFVYCRKETNRIAQSTRKCQNLLQATTPDKISGEFCLENLDFSGNVNWSPPRSAHVSVVNL